MRGSVAGKETKGSEGVNRATNLRGKNEPGVDLRPSVSSMAAAMELLENSSLSDDVLLSMWGAALARAPGIEIRRGIIP